MKNLYLLLFITFSLVCKSQNAADLEKSFGGYPKIDGDAYVFSQQIDGKILVGGQFTHYHSQTQNNLVRLNSDGTKDTTLNIGIGFDAAVYAMNLQIDGKILVGGNFTTYQGQSQNKLIRLNPDGTKDNTFNIGSGFNSIVYAINVQSDGKILIGGTFTTYQGQSQNRLIRLNSDGSKDNSFNIGTGFNVGIIDVYTQSDGKILIGGNFTTYQGLSQNRLIRLNSDGSKDTSFNIGTGFNNDVKDISVQADGKILVAGDFTTYQGLSQNRLIRLNSDGSKDTSFNIGTGFNNYINNLIIQTDGKILIGGYFTTYQGVSQNYLIRLNPNGTKDTSYDIGSGFNNLVRRIYQQTDGKILVGGIFNLFQGQNRFRLMRINTNGSPDDDFEKGTGLNDSVYKINLQSDGKIIAIGSFTSYGIQSQNRLIRFNSDGIHDSTFNIGSGFNNEPLSICTQLDGKILIGGLFTTYQGQPQNRLIRLNSDGSLDNSFNVGSGFNNSVEYVKLQSDGKIIVGGFFTTYQGVSQNNLIRLNSDGTIDGSFNIGSGFDLPPFCAYIQDDGKILVGGTFTTFQGQSQNKLIRLNSDGSKDNSFDIGVGFDNGIYSINQQTDTKIIVGGSFINYQNQPQNRLIRLNSNGTIDNSFTIGTGFNELVISIQIQTDGKILVGGSFNTYQNQSQKYLIRLNADGTKDNTFDIGTGFVSPPINDIIIQTDGKILIGGDYKNYNDLNATSFLVRLYGDSILSNESFVNQNDVSLWPNPTQNNLNINNLKGKVTEISIYNFEGMLVYQNTNIGTVVDVSNFASGLYIVKIITEEGEFTKKFIKE